MAAYYNEIEPYAAQWLLNLIKAGHIAPGEVDDRSIVDVHPADLAGFSQCHFFAGIGGWSLALRLAGWPDDRPVWTGSCPCQPFSAAGKRGGFDDARHLWPEFFRLIAACRPRVVMGEQVAAAVGKSWLDGVFADMEGVGYACGAAVVPACAVGAPHRRERLWFVADAYGEGQHWCPQQHIDETGRISAPRRDYADRCRMGLNRSSDAWAPASRIQGTDGESRRAKPGICLLAHGIPGRVGRLRAYGNAIVPQVAAEVIAAFLEVRP